METNIKVLIVDDMPAMRTIVRDMLEQIGFKDLTEAEDGDSAWRQVQDAAESGSGGFGLIVSDWVMPSMTGVELLRMVRNYSESQDIPFLMITGERDPEQFSEAESAGATDYIVKPFNASQLKGKLQELFERKTTS